VKENALMTAEQKKDLRLLENVGTKLYGPRYVRKLAKACRVSPSLVNKWPPKEPGLLNEYLRYAVQIELAAVIDRREVLLKLKQQLKPLPGRE
jgi:hypothetical protein